MASSNDLARRIDSVNFPSAPAVVVRLSQMLADDGVDGDELAKVMQLDAGISARVLRLANSVAFRGNGVESVQEAVLRIGVNGVRDIVFALSIVKTMRPLRIDYRQFWRHSLAVAQTAQSLCRRAPGLPDLPALYAGALLHDVGVLVLERALDEEYAKVLQVARESRRPLHEVERELLGTDHSEVGGRLLEVWRLPSAVPGIVRGHHRPLDEGGPAAALVHLADFVCNHQGIDHGTGFRPESCADEVWHEIGLGSDELEGIVGQLQQDLTTADAMLAAAG